MVAGVRLFDDSVRVMPKSGSVSRNSTASSENLPSNNKVSPSLRVLAPQQSLRRLGLCSQIATGAQHSSPTVFPEKRGRVRGSRRSGETVGTTTPTSTRADARELTSSFEHRIDIGGGGGGGGEKSDLLGYVVFSGKLVLDKRKDNVNNNGDGPANSADISSQEAVDAKLMSKVLVWGSNVMQLDDVISVIYIYILLFNFLMDG